MLFIRSASLDEILRACPEDEPTRDVVRACVAFGVWSLDGQELGSIGAQLPSGRMGTISTLFGEWAEWLRSSDARAPWSAAVHSGFVHLLRTGHALTVRPILLGPAMQVHDGRHRLFAAFEFVREKEADDLHFEVFWDRVD